MMFSQYMFLYTFKDNYIFNDIWAHLISFEHSKTVGWKELYKIRDSVGYLNYELGWRYYVKILSTLSSNGLILIFTTGFIIIYSYAFDISKYSIAPWFSLLLFNTIIFYNSLFIMRQNIAVAISIYSFKYIVERKIWKFILVIGTAILFHKTAIVLIVLYFLYPLKLSTKVILLFLFAAAIFNYWFSEIINIAIFYFDKYEVYKYAEYSANKTSFLISISVLLFVCVQYYPFTKLGGYNKLFFIMIILLTALDFARIGSESGLIGRLGIYFYPAIVILLPNSVNEIRSPAFKYLSVSIIATLYYFMMLNQMEYGYRMII
jgi:transmembrane protein EpsG